MGPTADLRIKPDLVAPGDQVVVAGNVGISLGMSSGTSLASPMLAGAIAALWSAFPEKSSSEILEAVYATSDQRHRPDNERGYGLPEMTEAWIKLGQLENGNGGIYHYEPISGELIYYWVNRGFIPEGLAEIRNILGEKVADLPIVVLNNTVARLEITGLQGLPAGHYQIMLKNEDGVRLLGFGRH